MNEQPKILHLVVTFHWFEMYKAGKKREDYREKTDRWYKRLVDFDKNGEPLWYKNFDIVRIHKGYTSEYLDYKFEDINEGFGNPELGAPELQEVFIIKMRDDEKNTSTK